MPGDDDMEASIGAAALKNTTGRTPPDPHRVGSVTVQAVNHIGETTAQDIEAVADSIDAAGKALAQTLRDLAAELRTHSQRAEAEIKKFVDMANLTRENVGQLATFVKNGGKAT